MQMTEIEEFRYPKRRPWLFLVLVAVAAFVFWMHRAGREETERAAEPPAASAEQPAAQAPRVSLPAHAGSDVDARDAVAAARAAEAAGDLLGARKSYLAVLKSGVGGRMRIEAEEGLGRVNIPLVMSPRPMPEKIDVVVARGDSLDKLAGQYDTTIDLIRVGNGIENPNMIKAGDHLRILTGKFALTVSKSRNDVVLTLNGDFFKRYAVGTGKFGKTPSGTFTIVEKMKEPVWWRPGGGEVPYGHADNILGTRWMSLDATGDTPKARGYGIHGTWDNSTIGKAVSAGCIRLRNEDVEELYRLVPLGTPVTILD